MVKQSIIERLKPYGWADENPVFGMVNAAVLRLKDKGEVKQFFEEYKEYLIKEKGKTKKEAEYIALSNIAFFMERPVYPEIEREINSGVERMVKGKSNQNQEIGDLISVVTETTNKYNSLDDMYNIILAALPELSEKGYFY